MWTFLWFFEIRKNATWFDYFIINGLHLYAVFFAFCIIVVIIFRIGPYLQKKRKKCRKKTCWLNAREKSQKLTLRSESLSLLKLSAILSLCKRFDQYVFWSRFKRISSKLSSNFDSLPPKMPIFVFSELTGLKAIENKKSKIDHSISVSMWSSHNGCLISLSHNSRRWRSAFSLFAIWKRSASASICRRTSWLFTVRYLWFRIRESTKFSQIEKLSSFS